MIYPNKIITSENQPIELGQLMFVHIGALSSKIRLAIVLSYRIGYWINVLCDEGVKTIHRLDISSLNDKMMSGKQ